MTFSFDKQKTLDVILYIAENLKRTDFHKIFKILYFADRSHLAEYGYPITGDTYIAMEAGPVPSKIYDIFKIVRGDSYISDTENLRSLFEVENWMYIKPKQKANMENLSTNEKETIHECIQQYGELSYDEIKEKSHDIAWRSTARDFIIKPEDMAREAGLNSDDLAYINELNKLQNALR